jgi:hypothetical protein
MADITGMIAGGLGSAWVTVANIASWVFYAGVVIVVLVVFIYLVKFKYPVTLIFESSGGGKRIKTDRLAINTKKNTVKALKNKNIVFPFPTTEHEYIRGNGNAYIATVRNFSASFLTITDNPHFIAADYDMREKLANDFKNSWSILKPMESFFDKYGQQILWIGSMGIFLVVIILILKRMDAIISLGQSVATAQVSANKQVIEGFIPALVIGGINEK